MINTNKILNSIIKHTTLLVVALYIIGLSYDQGYLSKLSIDSELFPRGTSEYLTKSLLFFLFAYNKIFEKLNEDSYLISYILIIPCTLFLVTYFIIKISDIYDKYTKYNHFHAIKMERLKQRHLNSTFYKTIFGTLRVPLMLFFRSIFWQVIPFYPFYFLAFLILVPYGIGGSSALSNIKKMNDLIDNKKNTNVIYIYENEKLLLKGLLITKSDNIIALYSQNKKTEIITLDNKIIKFINTTIQ